VGTNPVLRLIMGILPGTRSDQELLSHRPPGSMRQLLSPVNHSWSKCGQTLRDWSHFSPPIMAPDDV